jgi:uncharacterized protein
MSTEFFGVGWSFPVKLDQDGKTIALARYEESIRQAIHIILSTARGERVMRPDFGCGIYDLVFALNNSETQSTLANEVKQALLYWEPRIDVLDIQVSSGQEDQVLYIDISYRVRTTNNIFNLVYPFYLERSGA